MDSDATTDNEQTTLEPCPLLGHLPDKGEFPNGPYIAVSGEPGWPKFYAIVCPGCCSTSYSESKESVIKRWNTRVSAASTAPPHHALIQLLEASLLRPESAEGNIRQVIEALGSTAPVVDTGGFTCDCCGRNMEVRVNGKFCNECAGYRAAASPAAPLQDLNKAEVEYLAGLVRMELRKKNRNIERFTPRPGQSEQEAAEVKAGFAQGVERRQRILSKLTTALRADGTSFQPVSPVEQLLRDRLEALDKAADRVHYSELADLNPRRLEVKHLLQCFSRTRPLKPNNAEDILP